MLMPRVSSATSSCSALVAGSAVPSGWWESLVSQPAWTWAFTNNNSIHKDQIGSQQVASSQGMTQL